MAKEEETKVQAEKWRFQELFKEFFTSTPLSKGHLEVIEQNYKQELSQSLDETKDEIEEDFSKAINQLELVIEETNKKIRKIDKTLMKVQFWLKVFKWVGATIVASIIGTIVTATLKAIL